MDPYGGSEAEALAIYYGVSKLAPAQLWGISARLHPLLSAANPVRRARLATCKFPRDGVLVFVGAHWQNRPWTFLARPARVIYVFNTFHPNVLPIVTRDPPRPGWPAAEIVLISAFQRKELAVRGGVIHPSPIDISRFRPSHHRGDAPLAVGRFSRDFPDKYDPADFPLWRKLAERGIRVRLMGATKLTDPILSHPLIERLPEGYETAETFLRSLDVFLYRTGRHVETFGRVVLEAMACGLPVVCGAHGGYADHITEGVDGFLYTYAEEAERIVFGLLADHAMRAAVGARARSKAEDLFSEPAIAKRMAFYCGSMRKAPPVEKLL